MYCGEFYGVVHEIIFQNIKTIIVIFNFKGCDNEKVHGQNN